MKKVCFYVLSLFLVLVSIAFLALFLEGTIFYFSMLMSPYYEIQKNGVFNEPLVIGAVSVFGVVVSVVLAVLNYHIIWQKKLEKIISVEVISFIVLILPFCSIWEDALKVLLA